jgi:hypothetical protein
MAGALFALEVRNVDGWNGRIIGFQRYCLFVSLKHFSLFFPSCIILGPS